jgi:H+/gluconate symporter-like permease
MERNFKFRKQIGKSIFVISSLLAIIIGFLPDLMPDNFKIKIQREFGENYSLIWTAIFIAISIISIACAYYLYKYQEKETLHETIIREITSGKNTEISSSVDGKFSASEIMSHLDTNINVQKSENVDINKISSGENTRITIEKGS